MLISPHYASPEEIGFEFSLLWGHREGREYTAMLIPHIMGTPRRYKLCSNVDFSPQWGPQEGRGYTDILSYPLHSDLEKQRVM